MFVKLLLALAAIAAALPASVSGEPAESRQASDYLQVPEKVSPHIHVLRQAGTFFTDPVGNVVVIEQSDGLVLVDSGGSFGSGQRVVALVRAISRKPVKAVVLTHYHKDHTLGLSAVTAAWPHADIIANVGTIKAMQEGRPPGVPRLRSAEFEAQRAKQFEDAQKEYATYPALATTEAERAGWQREMAALPIRLSDIPGTYTVIPRHAFATRLTISDRDTPVTVLFLGRANTPGDTLVWVPSEHVLAAGDTVVEPIPYMYSVYPTEMLTVFKRVRALGFHTLIPGHGAPQQGHAYLDRIDALVRDVQRQVVPLAHQNVPLDQIAARTDFAAHRKAFAGGNEWFGFWFDTYTLAPLIESVYHEAKGDPLGPPPVQKAP
jgi:glyoxylase-like metal-dependent hydrolase (beta-lactamase superfamily II)